MKKAAPREGSGFVIRYYLLSSNLRSWHFGDRLKDP